MTFKTAVPRSRRSTIAGIDQRLARLDACAEVLRHHKDTSDERQSSFTYHRLVHFEPMRFAALFVLGVLPALSFADRLLTIPTGVTLVPGEATAEALYRTGNHRTTGFLQVGLPLFIELGAMVDDGHLALHLQYSIVQPFPEYSPGIAVGVWDAGNSSTDGRALWLAATWQFNVYTDWAQRERISFTLGGGSGPRFRGAFVGLELPVYTGWSLLMEHDSRLLTFGVGFEPTENVRFRALVQDGRAAYSFTLRHSF